MKSPHVFFLHPGCWFLYIFVHQILVTKFSSISVFIHDVIAFHAGTSDTDPQLASASHWWPVAGLRNTRPLVLTPSWQKSFSTIWVWINTYFFTIFSGLWTSINPSYFDVNYRGTRFWHTAIWPISLMAFTPSSWKHGSSLLSHCSSRVASFIPLPRNLVLCLGNARHHASWYSWEDVSCLDSGASLILGADQPYPHAIVPAGRWLFFRGLLPHWEVSGEAIRQFAKRI